MGLKIWCQVGGGVTPFSKLPHSREFSNIWFQKLTDIRYKRSLWTLFWKFQEPVSIWVLVGDFNFRLGTYNVPEGPSANLYVEARRAELCGWMGGWCVFTFPFLNFKTWPAFMFFFFYVLSYQGERFYCIFFTNNPKIGQVCRKLNQKSTLFARLTLFGNFWWRIYLSFLYFEKLSVVLSFFF